MFNKLRNKLLLINMLIITALIAGSFSVIYTMSFRNVSRDIERALNTALDITIGHLHTSPKNSDSADMPQENTPRRNNSPHEKPRIEAPFSSIFRYIIDSEGNITSQNFTMKPTDEEILEQINEKLPEIAKSGKDKGRITIGGTELIYRTKPFRSGYAVVLGEFNAELSVVRKLLLILIAVGIAAIGLAFLISLINANRSIRPIAESYEKQRRFVADASHELKTPLTTINTNLDVLLSHPSSTIDEEKKWLLYIKNETERMAKLTNDLLYLARLDHDGSVMFGETLFSDAAESVLLAMDATAFEKGIVIDDSIDENITVKASPDGLKQLVMILLDNAIKYTPSGGSIYVSLTADKDAVLTVRNTGEGIDKEDMKHLFERFYRSDKSRARESGGYGLGLAIAKALTESFGGKIEVSSREGEYTEFTVTLPAVKPSKTSASENK